MRTYIHFEFLYTATSRCRHRLYVRFYLSAACAPVLLQRLIFTGPRGQQVILIFIIVAGAGEDLNRIFEL